MLLTILMQQDAGGSGDLMHGPSRTPQVVPSSQLGKKKMLAVSNYSFMRVGEGGRGGGWSGVSNISS